MSQKKTLPPGVRIPAEYVELLTKGIPPSMDSDSGYRRVIEKFRKELDLEAHLRYAKRGELFREWISVPNVTLDQATWLLLGRDPWQPLAEVPETPETHQEQHFRTLRNLLDCEVAAQNLRPVGKFVPGFERRFLLKRIVQIAKDKKLAISTAEQFLEVFSRSARGKLEETPHQRTRLIKQYEIHRALIRLLENESSVRTEKLEKSTRKATRRKTQDEPINKRVFISVGKYNDHYRQLYSRIHGGEPEHEISDAMLEDDRRALNVKLRRGRPLGARTRPASGR